MNMSPEFSIVTVCLNEKETIGRTCGSICAQTCRDFEWIVIDGGSIDGTLDMLDHCRDRITHLVSEPDEGIYDAMNKGARLASGRYLLFLNAGDELADCHVLQTVSDAAVADIVFGDLVFAYTNGTQRVIRFPGNIEKNWLLKNMFPHQATFIKRSVLLEHGGYDVSYRLAGDYELFCRLLCRVGVSVQHLARQLAVFYQGGLSTDPDLKMVRKTENHRIRRTYFPRYLCGLKNLRMEARLLIQKLKKRV